MAVVKNDIMKLFDTIKSYGMFFLAFLILDDENLQQKSIKKMHLK